MKQLREFLRQQSTLTLATVDSKGLPAAADLYFATDTELKLYFISEKHAQHAQNLASNQQVAGSVHGQAWDWQEIRGLQFRGQCRPLTASKERLAGLKLYGQKFNFLQAFAAAITRHVVYEIAPHWMRWLDNGASFGHKQEWILKDGQWVEAE